MPNLNLQFYICNHVVVYSQDVIDTIYNLHFGEHICPIIVVDIDVSPTSEPILLASQLPQSPQLLKMSM